MENEFLKACTSGNLRIVNELSKILFVKDNLNSSIQTLLNDGYERACSNGHLNTVRLLIPKVSNFQHGILHASEKGYLEIVHLLIGYSGNKYLYSNPALLNACQHGHLEIVDFLLQNGADNINEGLVNACWGNQGTIVKYLIHHGAISFDAGMCNACSNVNLGLVELLIACGATDFNNALKRLVYVNNSDNEHYEQLVNLLVQKGANNLNVISDLACINGSINLVKIMVQHGATNLNQGLSSASRCGHLEVVKFIISCGANNLHDAFGECVNAYIDLIGSNDYEYIEETIEIAHFLYTKIAGIIIHECPISMMVHLLERGASIDMFIGNLKNSLRFKIYHFHSAIHRSSDRLPTVLSDLICKYSLY